MMKGRRLGIDRDVVTYSQYGMAAAPAGAAGQFTASARMKVAPGIRSIPIDVNYSVVQRRM